MAKQKKKRTKVYSGADAKITKPSITRVSAIHRNKAQQWWFDNKRIAKPTLVAASAVTVVIWLILELVRALGR